MSHYTGFPTEPIAVQWATEEEQSAADADRLETAGVSLSDAAQGLLLPDTQMINTADLEDDDYSTDSSIGGRQQQQQQQRQPPQQQQQQLQQGQQEVRPTGRRRRPPRFSPNRGDRETATGRRAAVMPEIYRHSSKPPQKKVSSHSHGLYPSDCFQTESEGTSAVNLEDLVKYSSADLLSRAWPLVPSSAKNLMYAPFSQLPELPDIVNVRHPDTDQVARFMRLAAVEIARRHTSPTPVFLRSLLVRAAASAEAKKAHQDSFSVQPYSEESLCANWEDECTEADESNIEDEWCSDNTVISSTDMNHVDALDWAMSVLSDSLQPKAPLTVLRLLHRVIDQCGLNSSSKTLHSWGLQQLTKMLIFQNERETLLVQHSVAGDGDSKGSEWLVCCVVLLFKIALATKEIDTLLVMFRWIYKHPKLSNELPLKGIAQWITSMESYARPRMRLPFPISWIKSSDVPLLHSLGLDFSRSIVGVCTVSQNDETYGVILTSKGIYKIALKPPYNVIGANESTQVKECYGVFVEDDRIAVQSKGAEVVTFYDIETLQARGLLDMRGAKLTRGFHVYHGRGRFVSPYYYHDEFSPSYAQFDASTKIKGTMHPNVVQISPETDSLSIQFFLCIQAVQQCTSLELINLKIHGKVWLSVRVSIDSRNSLVSIVFEHGSDVVTEVRESIQESWTLWSATLASVNDAATWTVYKDGVQLDSDGSRGVMFKLSAPESASVSFLEGTFSGFISGVQLWNRLLSVSELLAAATGKSWNAAQSNLLCSFKMNEGSGCCFQSINGTHVWKGTCPSWCVPQKTVRGRGVEGSEEIPYVVSGHYYIATNEYETAIVEDGFCTWVSADGRILEQQFMNVRPNEFYYMCTHTSRMYSLVSEKSGLSSLRWIQTHALPTSFVRDLASVKNSAAACGEVLRLVKEKHPLTPLLLSLYLLHQLNATILTDAKGNMNVHQIAQLFVWNQPSSQTLVRLVDMCGDLISLVTSSKVENDVELLLLCVCGRLLGRQLSWMGRGCPSSLVPTVVGMYERLHDQNCEPGGFLAEAQIIFSWIHRVFLMECVSHDYQLQCIMEAKKLTDVKDLLVPEHLPSLVASIMEKNLKKPFMTFLHRLKEESLTESESVLNGRSTPFKPSSATLTTLLCILSQKTKPEWHLVAVALLSSLCKGILRMFNRIFPLAHSGKGRTLEQLDVLKHTSIGIVVFPLAHYLSDLEIDSSAAVDVLSMLNEMREALTSYIPSVPSQSVSHCFTETHRVLIPANVSHTVAIDLRHAKHIEVSYEYPVVDKTPQLYVSLVTNEYKRVVETVSGSQLILKEGGKMEIASKPTGNNKDTAITVTAQVELRTELTHWIRDICYALSHATLRITHGLLLTDLPDAILLPRKSLFRGGLSQEALKEHRVGRAVDEGLLDKTDQVELLRLCDNTGDLLESWRTMYTKKRVPYQERLEPLLRLFSSAHVWHSHRPRHVSLQKSLENSLEFMRKKAFLILESLQQGGEDAMLERARFLLKMVNPRARLESLIAEHQETEEPITSVLPTVSTHVIPNVRSVTSVASFSHDRTESQSVSFMRRMVTGTSELSNLHYDGIGSILRPRNSLLGSGVISEGIQCSPESISSQIMNFLLRGYNGISNEELVQALVKKAQQASIHTAAYKLQEELCAAHQSDKDMAWSIVSSHLLYRELVYLQHAGVGVDVEGKSDRRSLSQAAPSKPDLIDQHYIDLMMGCGFHRELELQKASCGFVHSIIQQSLLGRSESKAHDGQYGVVGAVSLCAILCHPWDSVDMSIIRPAKIFRVLKNYLFSALDDASPSQPGSCGEDTIWMSYAKECGIFSLLYRGVIIPNTLQLSAERVSIVEGDTLGVVVENADACCMARNHWRTLRADAMLSHPSTERDCFASHISGCVVVDMPEALYFEVTIEIMLNEQALVSIGLAGSPLSSAMSAGKDNSVVFSSDGTVRYGRPLVRFSDVWSNGDVIGCGVMSPFNGVFFTRNGEFLGIATECAFTTMIPFVAVQAMSTLVKLIVNFGENSPFKFDIASLHGSCRTHLSSPAMLSDSAFVTVHYLVTLCFRNLLLHEKSESTVNEDSVCALLEEASVFLREVVLELVRRLKHMCAAGSMGSGIGDQSLQNGGILLARLFRTVNIVIDCFRFSAVTSTTHLEILRLCSVTLIDAHDRWAKVRAARCLGNAARILRQDYFGEAVQALRRFVTQEVVVNSLAELARTKVFCERDLQVPVPRWVGGGSTVVGKGAFFGATPMPAKGTHMVGFRIRRRQQEGRGTGAPLGGCYYVGLTHGHPPVTNMSNLISRKDVYVLQDTDDQDQVPHLLLRRHCIPCGSQRRIYGNDEIVWVELNADLGEITYYREKMIPIGLAFANIQRVDDLYPFVFHFNEDASCELIQAPTQDEDPSELLLNGLQRSVAIHTLQQLHVVPYFGNAVSEWVRRFLARSQQNLENCLVALAILGGEKSCEFCQHKTYGAVVLDSISDVASKAIVCLEADGDMRLFSTSLLSLKPSFVSPPIFSLSETESLKCSTWLLGELCRSLYEASVIVPLLNCEEERRREIEDLFFESTTNTMNLDFVGLLCRGADVADAAEQAPPTPLDGLLPRLQSTSASFKMVNGRQVASATPVTVDKRLSSNSLFAPNPSIGVTSRSGYSVIRGNVLLEDVFSFAVSITTEENEDFLWYVGVSSETRMYVDPRKVALCKKTWALCCQDSTETNNINCSVEPGMIISAEHILFGSGDIVIVQVDRGEGTVSFSRIRCGKRVDFGVLFETIPSKEKLRPFILAGPNSVVVFSFLGCSMFPSRSIFPPSSVTSWKNSSSSMRCSSCEVDLESFWYEGEGGICLCRDCFTCWKYPKAMFHLSQAEVPVSDYLVSQHSPRKLLVDSFVEFVEDTVFTWVDDKSVNVDIEGSICVARRDTAFASLETFNAFGNQRIDVCLGHVAGVDGFSFGGLQPFSPLWRIENTSSVRCSVDSDMLLVSSSVIPHGTKVVMELKFSSEDESRTLNAAGIFIGVTNLLSDYRTISMAELERRIANHNMWGTWCDTRKKISPSLTVWLLVDMTRGSIMVSSSLSGLYMHPVVVTCNCPVEEEANLRVAIFSHDRCHVTSCSGFVSLNDSIVRPSPSPLAIGLVPENVMDSNCEVINTSCFLFDTLARTTTQTAASWELAPLVHQEETDVLFSIGDTITIVQEQLILTVYRNGLLIATQTLSEEFLSTPQRFVVYFSTRGMIATTVPPLYGKSHLGKVIRTYGTEIGIVECICPCQGNRRYAVRRKEVRYCALPADTQTIDVGTRVAFKAGSLNVPKRGTVMSIENNAANIRDDEEKRTWFSVEMGCIYLLENEGPEEVSQGLYPLLTLPSSSITRVFEVGKTKYRLQRNGSYNGIMFDVQAHNPVVLTGLSVLTYTTGRHRVEVFFKKGSHHTHEREAGAWTKVFSNLVEMHSERQFTITFPGIQAEANTTFSLYINATHNCGVGHYSKEDGCTGAISNKMDSDGTLTVFVGRTSESSSPFFETSSTPRGFCGSIMYMQSMDTRPPLVERISSSSVETPYTNCDKNSNTVILRSHPVTSSLASTAEFVVEVIGGPIVIRKLYLPMLLDSSVRQCVGSLQLRVSLFYAPMDSHADAQEKERRWVWAYHAVMPLRSDTCWFRMEDMEVFLKRGNYIFNAVCEKDVGGVGVGRGEGGGERLACFLKAKEESYTVKNKVYSVRGLAGEIHATVTNNVIISDDLCVISTGGHLNQNNSASYNGIMFDIRSKRDILLEEVFCVAQTTTDNVNVKVFWKEGSIEGAEKTPSQWQQVVAKDLYLADKQPFSPGLLNLQLRANQMYALYINTTSSCGVRFYNSSDGHVGDVGDEFEDDGVVTVFVGKKSESPLPFSEIPAEPRALRGRITYRAFMQEISLGLNQAIFPALKGFVVARILAALIAYAGGTTSCTTPFEDSTVIETLAKLATPKTNAVCDAETAGNLLSSMMKESLVEELREGILTLSLSGGDMANFSSFAKGDLALVAKDGHASSTGRLVRLLEDPDENSCVVVKDETVATNHYSLSLDSLLPIIECQDCHQPFGTTRICGATGKKHMPLSSEEDQLINILIKYFSQRGNVSSEVSSAQVRSLVQDPASCAPCFDERLTNVSKRAHCLGVVRDGHTVEYTVPLDILSKGKEDGVVAGFVSHFLYSESMKAYVSLSFTPTVDSWSVVFLCDLPYRLAADTPVKVFLVSLAAILQDGSKEDLLSSPATYYVGRGGKIHQPLSTLASSLHYSCLQRDGCIHLCLNVQEAPLPSLTPSVPTPRERWLWANGSDCVELQPTKASLLNGCFGNAMWSKDKPRFCQLTVTSETNDNVFFLEAQVTISKTVSKLLWDEGRKRVIHRSFSISRDEELNLAFTVDGDFVVYDEDDSIRCHVAFDDLQLSSTKSLPPTIAIVNVGSHPVKAHLQCQNFAKPRKMMDRSGNWSTELGSYSPEWVSYDPLKVIVSKNGLTASCNGASGQAVIGSHLPVSGLSAFVVRIERSDRARGDSLGAGHFAGIVVSTFDELAPHFEMLRNRVNSIWAVQDVYDTDSLPTQERMPPISASGDELFLAGTKLRFLLNREDGTLSLARDNESPRVVFRNIPPNIPLSPFVRLDHARASATLAPLSCGAWGDGGGVMTPPSMMFTSHPVTPSILRRFPYSVVLSMFAVFRGMIGLLPSVQVSVIEDTWDNRFLSTRFGYRLSVALQSLVELGAFSRTMAHASEEEVEQFCSRTEMQKIINDLSQKPDKSVVVLRDANNIGDDFVLLLPDRYEVVGRIENSFMVRLWHFGDDGPSERTLHVFRLDDSEACVKACNVVTKHPCVMYQEEIVEGVKGTSCCGVITHGWYDCTLSSISMMKFNEHQQGVIAKSIMGALEHWHLHCLPHGHVSPENIYLRLSGNDVISCVLWDAHYVERHHKGASPRLRSHGIRDMKGDRWSCAHILSSFASFLSENTTFGRAVELMKNTEKNISEVLDETGTLAEESKKTVDGPVLCLRIGTNLKEGAGSYNGIMFDLVAKRQRIKVTKLSFFPDTNSSARVSLFVRDGTFMGVETERQKWRLALQRDMELVEKVETEVAGFYPINIPPGEHVAFFLHTTSGGGVLFYSEADGVRANMGAVEEENEYIGITVGKKSESVTPFMGIQNQKRVLKGSITYALSKRNSGYRSQIVASPQEVNIPLGHRVGRPVLVFASLQGLILGECEETCLVYFVDGHTEWVQWNCVKEISFNESPVWEELEKGLQQRLLERRRTFSGMLGKCSCNRQLHFHKTVQTNDMSGELQQRNTWWVSDPIRTTSMVSVWQVDAQTDATLFVVTSPEGSQIDFSNGRNILEHGQTFFFVEEWSRSVTSSVETQVVIKQLQESLSKSPLYLVVGPVKADAGNVPVSAFLSIMNTALAVKETTDTTAVVSLDLGKYLQENFVLNGAVLSCCTDPPKPPVFTGTSSITWHRGVRVTQIPSLKLHSEIEPDQKSHNKDDDEGSQSEMTQFFVELQPREGWIDSDVILHVQSQCLEVSDRYVQQIDHGDPPLCVVTKPTFGGPVAHEVELLILSSIHHPVQITFQHSPTSWIVSVPLPVLNQFGESYLSPSASVRNIHLRLFVLPCVKRVLASVDGGVMYEVLPGISYPSEFHLAFSLSGPGSSVRILRWRMMNKAGSAITRETLETIWAHLKPFNISPNISHTVGVLTRHSRTPVGAPTLRSGDMRLVSQIEAVIISYARQLLGTVVVASKPSKVQKRLQSLLPFTPLRGDLVALESLVSAGTRRASFFLIGEAYACLATPAVGQSLETVETSVNIIYASLNNDGLSRVFSTAYGSTLILLLLRTATVYTRSVRHVALRSVLKLLKTPHCDLPSHETLCASFAPLLGMMNGLCRKGKMSSVVVQLGISLICELIRRYQLERPTLVAPGKNSAVPYAIVTCTKVAIGAITRNPPVPLPEAFTQEPKETHRIIYELRLGPPSQQGFKSSYGVFTETFRCTFGTKKFRVVLGPTRSGSVVVGWDMDAVLPGSRPGKTPRVEDGSPRVALPSSGYFIEPNGKIFICINHTKELQPLKVRAKAGDVIAVKCLYHEQVVIIDLYRSGRSESTTRFETYPNEMLALPVFYAEREGDATFDGESLSEVSTGMDVAQLYNDLQQYPDRPDTAVIPQSYAFYAELALYCQSVLGPEESLNSVESAAMVTAHSHDLAGFPLLSAFLGVSAFSTEVPLHTLVPYVKRLKIFDVLTSVFSVVVDLRRKTELFDLWNKLKGLCSAESSEKIQNETMRPFRNRPGNKARVIIHTMQAHPSARLGPYPTLMRSIFGQLFVQLQGSPISTFYASPMFTVKLAGFGSTDAGGPYRDVLSQLATEVMTTHPSGTFQLNPLFAPCGRGGQSAVMPNVALTVASQSSLMFEFFGKLLAACFVTKDLLAVEFPPLFWKFLLSEETSTRDLVAMDPDILRQLTPEELMDRTADELEERFPGIQENWMMFCAENPEVGAEIDFPPNNTPSAELLAEQISMLELHRYDTAMGYIQHGFDEVIPLYTLNAFRWQQVELGVCGTPKLSYDALRKVCEVGLPAGDAQMFLEVISSMTDEDRMLLLRFTTGQTRLPLREAIKVQRGGAHNSLPTSSTCFFTLRLPSYSSADAMRERILYAVRQCKAIDTDGQAREHIVLDS